MKKTSYILLCIFIFGSTLGCQNTKTNAVEGGVIGGIVGAAAGGIIGHQSGHGGEGAGIGLAAGALTGAVIGSQINKPGQQASQGTAVSATGAQGSSQANPPSQLTQQQIIDMTKQGVNEAVIVDKIKITNSKFNLTANDITNLKNRGVSLKVIDAMQGL